MKNKKTYKEQIKKEFKKMLYVFYTKKRVEEMNFIPIEDFWFNKLKSLAESLRVEEKSVLDAFAYQGPKGAKAWLKREGRYYDDHNHLAKEQNKKIDELGL